MLQLRAEVSLFYCVPCSLISAVRSPQQSYTAATDFAMQVYLMLRSWITYPGELTQMTCVVRLKPHIFLLSERYKGDHWLSTQYVLQIHIQKSFKPVLQVNKLQH